MRLASNALRILSLLLFIAAGIFWVRSYWINDRYSIATADGELDLGSVRGGIYYISKTNPADGSAKVNADPGYHAVAIDSSAKAVLLTTSSFAGFEYGYVGFFGVRIWTLKIPYWVLMTLLFLLLVGPPLLQINRRKRRRRNGSVLPADTCSPGTSPAFAQNVVRR